MKKKKHLKVTHSVWKFKKVSLVCKYLNFHAKMSNKWPTAYSPFGAKMSSETFTVIFTYCVYAFDHPVEKYFEWCYDQIYFAAFALHPYRLVIEQERFITVLAALSLLCSDCIIMVLGLSYSYHHKIKRLHSGNGVKENWIIIHGRYKIQYHMPMHYLRIFK